MKLLGYVPFKEKVGKVLFVIEEHPQSSKVAGYTTDKIFVSGSTSEQIDSKWIGKEITVSYTSLNGRAFVSEVRLIG